MPEIRTEMLRVVPTANGWALEETNGSTRATRRASVGGTNRHRSARSQYKVSLAKQGHGANPSDFQRCGRMGSPATASSCGEQTAHPNPPWGHQRKQSPGRRGKDGSVVGMSRPPCPHQGSWADCLEQVGECQWAKFIS